MRRECAWCGEQLGERDDGVEGEVTHGICGPCGSSFRFQSGVELREYLESLDAPVLAVDDQGTLVTANTQALTALDKSIDEVVGQRGGDVMECANARLPGGCGKTEHCVGCTIRQTVMHTHATGIPVVRRPAWLRRRLLEEDRVWMSISTRKVDDVVLLRIDTPD